MGLNLARIMRIERDEQYIVYAMLLQSIFIGIFAGSLDIGANALFLEKYSAELIPQAFMISGIVGIIFTSIYTFFQSRMGFKWFAVLNLIAVLFFTAALRFSFYISDSDWLSFAVFVLMGPLIIITLLGFWGTTGRLFTLRQGKRLFGKIDAGQVVGMILAFYAIPVLVNFNFIVLDTLYIGLGSLLIATIIQIFIVRSFSFVKRKDKSKEKRKGFFTLFSNRYTFLMALFISLSVIVAFFIHYSFLWVTEAQYPINKDLVAFLGTFMGTMMVFTFIIKSFFYGWLMKTYGLRVALLISPVLLVLLTVIASFVGGFFGYSSEAKLFTLFFLLIALSKLFNKSLKDSIEVPSLKVLYQSLAPGERYNVQARIDGTVNEITAFFAGVIMAGLVLLSFVKIIHFTYILLFFLVLWFIIGMRLYTRYKRSLQSTLAQARKVKPMNVKSYLPEKIFSEDTALLAEMLMANPYFNYFLTDKGFTWLISHKDAAVREIAKGYSNKSIKFLSNSLLKKALRDRMQRDIKGYINYLRKIELPSMENLEDAINSADKEVVFAALLATAKKGDAKQIPHIITLFRDPDIEVRMAAIETCEILKSGVVSSYLIDYLGHPALYKLAWTALVNIGEDVIEYLENAFHRTGIESKVQLRIIRAMAAIGGDKATTLLLRKIDYHQREVMFESVKGLYANNYRATEAEKAAVFQAIYNVISMGAWNVAAEYTITQNDPKNGLVEAVKDEIERTNELLLMLLAIIYDKNSIKHIWNTLNNPESHDISYAVELLNLLVDDQIRDYVESYIEDCSISEKLRRLQSEFPVELLSYDSLIHEIVCRDGLLLGDFIRVCALDAANYMEEETDEYLLPAQLFHPHPVIRQSAGIVLKKRDSVAFKNLSERSEVEILDFQDFEVSQSDSNLHPRLSIMNELIRWPLFSKVDLNELFKMALIIKPFSAARVEDKNCMTLIRSNDINSGPALFNGMAIIVYYHKEYLEQISYIATLSDSSLFQVEVDEFGEVLFNSLSLLEYFNDRLINTKAADLENLIKSEE